MKSPKLKCNHCVYMFYIHLFIEKHQLSSRHIHCTFVLFRDKAANEATVLALIKNSVENKDNKQNQCQIVTSYHENKAKMHEKWRDRMCSLGWAGEVSLIR